MRGFTTKLLFIAALFGALLSPLTFAAGPDGFIALRVYLPANGASSIVLPTLTFTYADGTTQDVKPCSESVDVTLSLLQNLAATQPSCAWALTYGAPDRLLSLNVAFPDTSAVYWVTPFMPDPSLKITIKGVFPDARYMSFNAYDGSLSSFANAEGIASAISDFEMRPDAGYMNPWQQPALAGGRYAVRIAASAGADPVNFLPMPPVTGAMVLGNLPEPCYDSACPPYYKFLRPEASATRNLGANVNNAYISALNQPAAGQVLVVRGKLPATVPTNHATPWPAAGTQLRYWSICNNVFAKPYPVTGCLADRDLNLDANGYYTVVIGAPMDKPLGMNVTRRDNWLENSMLLGWQRHIILVRNMLPNNFAKAIQNAPESNSPDATKAAMGEYYPVVTRCSSASYALRGLKCTL